MDTPEESVEQMPRTEFACKLARNSQYQQALIDTESETWGPGDMEAVIKAIRHRRAERPTWSDVKASEIRPTCVGCGSSVMYDLVCHTWPQTRSDGSVGWMACLPCDTAILYMCDAEEDCGWQYTHGLNSKNPRSVENEKNRPSWIVSQQSSDQAVRGARLLGTASSDDS